MADSVNQSAVPGDDANISIRELQGVIALVMRYYPQLSVGEQILVERVAERVELQRQAALVASMPVAQAPTPPETPQTPQDGIFGDNA